MNASEPTISLSTNLVVQQTPSSVTITIANPSTNAYGITAITVTAPSGWNFSLAADTGVACPAGFSLGATSLTAFSCTAGSLLPGFSGQIVITKAGTHGAGPNGVQGPSVASGASPVSGVFTTSLIDSGSSPAAYSGPSFTMWSIVNPVSVTVTPGATNFAAGSAPVTLTAQLGSNEPGVPVAWSTTSGSLASSSSTTGSTGAATIQFTPSNTAGVATITAAVAGTSNTATVTTVANVPNKITFTIGVTAFPSSHYVTTPVTIGSSNYANIPASTLNFAITDAYGNAVSGVSGLSGTFTATNGFWNGVTTTVTDPTNYAVANGALAQQYSQSGTYGAVGLISGTFTGTYNSAAFSVSGSTGQIVTSTFGTYTIAATTNGVTMATNIGAGKYVIPQVTVTAAGDAQPGLPVTINECVHSACAATSKGYTGGFVSNGLESITVATSTTSPSTGNASAHYSVSTTLNQAVAFNATVLAPVDGATNTVLSAGTTNANPVTTVAGSAAQFKIAFDLLSGDAPSTTIVPGATGYLNIYTADKYGNVVTTGLSQQTQISLAASAGTLSVTSAYIPAGAYQTNETVPVAGFGPISWTFPGTVGTVGTLTVSGVLGGVSTSASVSVTVVSATPTITVTSPKPSSGVIYSQTAAVVFTGTAAVSSGYPSVVSPVNINSIGYKVGTGSWQSAVVTPGNSITWSVAATAPVGLSTVTFNATDSKSNTVVSQTYTVLVDTTPPTFTIGTPAAGSGCDAVTIATAAGDFNTTSFSATYGTATIPSSSISWSGTQTLGTAGSITANVCGLTAGTNTLTVSGKSDTGVSASNSASITITVSFSSSITFGTSSAAWATVGAYSGINVPVTNSWNTAQTVVVYATLKSGTSIYVAEGTTTLSAGQTGSVFAIGLQNIPAGSYQVTFSAVTTSNAAVSAPTTPITVVVP